MIHEEYVSIETAKMLKQAGFDWEVRGVWCIEPANGGNPTQPNFSFAADNFNNTDNFFDNPLCNWYSAPTQAVAQRWLREVKGIVVTAEYKGKGDDIDSMYFQWGYSYEPLNHTIRDKQYNVTAIYSTYEAALEAGLQKCLTIILEEKK